MYCKTIKVCFLFLLLFSLLNVSNAAVPVTDDVLGIKWGATLDELKVLYNADMQLYISEDAVNVMCYYSKSEIAFKTPTNFLLNLKRFAFLTEDFLELMHHQMIKILLKS